MGWANLDLTLVILTSYTGFQKKTRALKERENYFKTRCHILTSIWTSSHIVNATTLSIKPANKKSWLQKLNASHENTVRARRQTELARIPERKWTLKTNENCRESVISVAGILHASTSRKWTKSRDAPSINLAEEPGFSIKEVDKAVTMLPSERGEEQLCKTA